MERETKISIDYTISLTESSLVLNQPEYPWIGITIDCENSIAYLLTYFFFTFILAQATSLKSAAVEVDTKAALATAANEARGLAMDSIRAAASGHMGLPLGAAEIGATLYGQEVSRKIVAKLCFQVFTIVL